MSFIQCKDLDEVEKMLDKSGFVTEDHRIYTEITLSDDALFYKFNSDTALALLNLQDQLEFMSKGDLEVSFSDIVKNAQELQDVFNKALELIKFKPIERIKK